MKTNIMVVLSVMILALVGCRQSEKSSAEYPSIVYDTVVEPNGQPKVAQLFIKNSVPVMPGARVDIVMGDAPAHAIISNVVVQEVRWKLKNIGLPHYPADGFVTLTLADNQWESFRSKEDLRLFPHNENKTK